MSQYAVDASNKASNKAHKILLALGTHLRVDHKLSRKEVALRIGESEKWVKQYIDKVY